MSDPAHDETDAILSAMEQEIDDIYRRAAKEMHKKSRKYLAWFAEADKNTRALYEAGEIAQSEFIQWRISHLMTGSHFALMAKTLSDDMLHSAEIASDIINNNMPEIYAINHNYGTYLIEHGAKINTNYELYDVPTVKRLIREKPDLIPIKSIVKIPEMERWNMNQVSSIMTQGILQGDDIPTLATRISTDLPTRNRNAAIRDARTMTTSAQNGGREDAYKRGEDMGIEMVERWVATLDGRTRHAHRVLDGQKKKVGGTFFYEDYPIRFPGDPQAEPWLVYNCRCTTIAEVKDTEILPDNFVGAFGYSRDETLGDMTYDEWKADKGNTLFSKSDRNRKGDAKQYYEYRKLIGKDKMPANIKEFQRIKYTNPNKWAKMKQEAADERREKAKRKKKVSK